MTTALTPRRKSSATLPEAAPPPRPRPIVDGRAEYPLDLVLDGRLKFSTRMIVGALAGQLGPGQVASWDTDEAIAGRFRVTPKTAQNALREAELGGWIARMTPDEFQQWGRRLGRPALYDHLPRPGRVAKRLIVLLWAFPDRLEDLPVPSADPEDSCEVKPERNCEVGRRHRKRSSATAVPPRKALPDHPEPMCEPHAGASNPRINEEFNENVLVPPPSPKTSEPEGTPDFASWPPSLREKYQAAMRAVAEAPAPPEAPRMATWSPSVSQGVPNRAATNRARQLRAEELVAALVGPEASAAMDALLVFLAAQFRDAKPETRQFWGDRIALMAATEGGRVALLELIRSARSKESPARWFSACLARGRPGGAHEAAPGFTRQRSPGAARNRLPRPISECTQGGAP